MVINGIFDKIGSELIVKLDGILHCQSLDSFTDSTQNEIAERYFEKYFRYSQTEKSTWSNWYTLTDLILQGIVLEPTLSTYVEVKYLVVGTDNTTRLMWLTFNLNVTLDLTIVDTFYPLVFNNPNQMFGDISVNDPTLRQTCINVTKKILDHVYPKFIVRTDDLTFLTTLFTTYFTLFFVKAKQLYEFYNDRILLLNWLTKKGLYFSGEETLAELQPIYNNYLLEFRKRGTINVISEIKRLINYKTGELFMFELLTRKDIGWYLDISSPDYNGLERIRKINQMVEKNGVIDLDNYYTIGTPTIINDTDNNMTAIKTIKLSNTKDQGIKCSTLILNDPRNIQIDANLDYEISFRIKQLTPSTRYAVGLNCYDKTGSLLTCLKIDNTTPSDYFWDKDTDVTIYPQSQYVKIKGIIYNQNHPNLGPYDTTLNIGTGTQLKFPVGTLYVYPIIYTDEAVGITCDVRIYDIRVAILNYKPIVSFLESNNVILNFMTNNSQFYTQSEVSDIINRYLIPFSAQIESNFITAYTT